MRCASDRPRAAYPDGERSPPAIPRPVGSEVEGGGGVHMRAPRLRKLAVAALCLALALVGWGVQPVAAGQVVVTVLNPTDDTFVRMIGRRPMGNLGSLRISTSETALLRFDLSQI